MEKKDPIEMDDLGIFPLIFKYQPEIPVCFGFFRRNIGI